MLQSSERWRVDIRCREQAINGRNGDESTLNELFTFIYKASFDNGLTEHELDHVLIGFSEKNPKINPEEVASFKWLSLEEINKDLVENPKIYTVWFSIIFDRFYKYIQNQKTI